jgi:hypothetical protein
MSLAQIIRVGYAMDAFAPATATIVKHSSYGKNHQPMRAIKRSEN